MWWSMAVMALVVVATISYWMIVRHRSGFVAVWHEPVRDGLRGGKRLGPLWVRTAGEGDTVFMLLHGLGATGLVWGAGVEELADRGVLFIPDLLGWGGSLDTSRDSYTLEAHMSALDESLASAGLSGHRLAIGGHSMGAMLALRFAERHVDRVDRVVTWGAPIHADIDRRITEMGWMPRLFAMDAKPAQLVCRVMCARRSAAARMAVVSRPDIPAPLAAASVEHTWPSYRGSLRSLVVENDWREPISTLGKAGVSVELQWGSDDEIGSPEDAEDFASEFPSIKVVRVTGGDHHLPFVAASSAVVAALTIGVADNQ